MSFCSSDSFDRKGLTHFFSFRFLGECCGQHPWRTSLVVNVFLFFMMLLFPIGYGVNDDVQMEWLIFNDDSPWGMCCFIHPLLSFIVKQLSIFSPSIAWYSWMMYGTVFVSFSIILGVVLRFINKMQETPDKIKNGLYFVYIGGLAYFIIDAYLYMQYTQTALAALLAGLLLMIRSQSLKPQLKKLLWVMGGLFLFSLGYMIRKEVVYIVAPFICFYVMGIMIRQFLVVKIDKKERVFKAYLTINKWRNVFRGSIHYVSIFILCIVSISTLIFVKSTILHSAHGWEEMKERVQSTACFYDYPNFSRYLDLSKAGFSEEELELVRTWIWFDPKYKTIDKIKACKQAFVEAQPHVHRISLHGIKALFTCWFAVPVVLLYLFFMIFTKNKRLSGITIALFFIIVLYLYIGRVTERTLYGTYLSSFIFLIISQKQLSEKVRSIQSVCSYWVVFVLAIIGGVITGWNMTRTKCSYDSIYSTLDEYKYFVNKKDNFYICSDTPSIYPRNPFLHTKEIFDFKQGNNSLSLVGWFTGSPTYEKVLNQGEHAPGIDLYQKLVTQDNFYVVTYKVSDESEFPLTIVLNYISKKMNVPVIAERCQDTESHTIWKLKQDGSSKVRE